MWYVTREPSSKEKKTDRLTSQEVHVGTPVDKCREINTKVSESPDEEGGYAEDIFENLIYRYEEPNGMTRWDRPLFTVPFEDAAPPCDEIWEAIIGSEGKIKTVKPNQATVMVCRISQRSLTLLTNCKKPAVESDYLYELDRTSQEIINTILAWQKDHPGEGGGEFLVAESTVTLPPNSVTLPQLQRIRRQFISLNRQHNLAKDRISALFVEYLNDNLN